MAACIKRQQAPWNVHACRCRGRWCTRCSTADSRSPGARGMRRGTGRSGAWRSSRPAEGWHGPHKRPSPCFSIVALHAFCAAWPRMFPGSRCDSEGEFNSRTHWFNSVAIRGQARPRRPHMQHHDTHATSSFTTSSQSHATGQGKRGRILSSRQAAFYRVKPCRSGRPRAARAAPLLRLIRPCRHRRRTHHRTRATPASWRRSACARPS